MRVRCLHFALSLVLLGQALEADFAAGMTAYEKHDYATAVKEWRPLAEAGDAPTQFNLGLMYLDGVGVPQNSEQAIEWFRKSANRGYAKAQYNLGSLYALGHGVRRDFITAHMWMNLCAASGDAKCAAQRDLIAGKMKARDLATAQRRATDWKPVTPETK